VLIVLSGGGSVLQSRRTLYPKVSVHADCSTWKSCEVIQQPRFHYKPSSMRLLFASDSLKRQESHVITLKLIVIVLCLICIVGVFIEVRTNIRLKLSVIG
jgi:hypothetical protein